MTPLKSDKNVVQKIGDKVKMKNVLKEYNDLFVESKILERIIPRKINSPNELRQFSKYILKEEKDYDESDIDGINDGVLVPIYDLIDRGGKRWRPVLGMIYAELVGRNVAEAIAEGRNDCDDILFACGLTEYVHNGSLMVDDVEDRSLMRRG